MPGRQSQKHSITINGHRTSITLETAFWDSLKEIAEAENKSLTALIASIDGGQPDNLSGALRVYILNHYKSKAVGK